MNIYDISSQQMDDMATEYLNGMYESQYDDDCGTLERVCEVCCTRFIGKNCPFEGDSKHNEFYSEIPF